jgi:hypothetical protein
LVAAADVSMAARWTSLLCRDIKSRKYREIAGNHAAPSAGGVVAMNIVLWIAQIALALLYFSGGAYKVFGSAELVDHVGALSRGGWIGLGIVEMIGAILLVVPAPGKWMPVVAPLAAAALALETLALAAMYASLSLDLTAANPLVWAATMGVLAAIVAYGRYMRPLQQAAG